MTMLYMEGTIYLRSQFATSNTENVSSKGGRRYLPYVFTEQGIAMLSAVLRRLMRNLSGFLPIFPIMKKWSRRYFLKGRYMMHSVL